MNHTKPYLLDRALKLFNKNGFVNVRLQHIADYGGISVGHLAYHFKHKDCLVDALYDQLKEAQETSLYEFRMAHLFEDVNRQLRHIFQCQQHYLFFYLDTLEVLRAYPSIKDKHQQHTTWQIQQIEWMFHFNVDRNTFQPPVTENQYSRLAWLFWMTMDNWMYARQIKGLDHLNEDDFIYDLWSLIAPYLTKEAQEEIKILCTNSNLRFFKPSPVLKKISTWHIHLKGQVQGVGFRPFIYQRAQKINLTGWVNNTNDGVHLEFNADEVIAKKIYEEVLSDAPPLSHITAHTMRKKPSVAYENFRIICSSNKSNHALLLPPDFTLCEKCRHEIKDKTNRRFNYAFTTCTQCGPRYSIIGQLPYDRENTMMQAFEMCNGCTAEYNDPMNRRYFSQTNSCPHCPIMMKLLDNGQNSLEEDQAKIIPKICRLWEDGKIIAIKGIGGYLLTCDASNPNSIKELRRRKNRLAKPFALMYPDINLLQNEVYLNEEEKIELKSAAAPIVLLPLKGDAHLRLALREIAPQLSKIGAMLPYTPLYELLLQHFYKPIVATSGNSSSAPIVFEDDVALHELHAIADYLLVHNREIIAPQDDSVVTYSRHSQKRIILRRARGFAPLYRNKNVELPPTTILATGALLKSSFTLLHQQNIHVSQYIGDTNNYDAQNNFNKTLQYFLQLFHTQPEVVLIEGTYKNYIQSYRVFQYFFLIKPVINYLIHFFITD